MEDDNIIVIDSWEHVRKRPGMYVGGTDRQGLHHMLYQVFDDILANHRAGRGGATTDRWGRRRTPKRT